MVIMHVNIILKKIRDGSCDANRACQVNRGVIKEESCGGEIACDHNSGVIKNSSCVSASSCPDNPSGVIIKN